MKVNYFDFGLCGGEELHWMVDYYFPQLGVEEYCAYGFEAMFGYYNNVKMFYEMGEFQNDKVSVIHGAIADTHGEKIKLYHHPNTVGHSIFSTKDNISKQFEFVQSIIFSEWLLENSIVLEGCLNILKVNIEGAELHLFKDIIKNDLVKHFSFYIGSVFDVEKIQEFRDKPEEIQEFFDLLEEHNIDVVDYFHPNEQRDIVSLIDIKLQEIENEE